MKQHMALNTPLVLVATLIAFLFAGTTSTLGQTQSNNGSETPQAGSTTTRELPTPPAPKVEDSNQSAPQDSSTSDSDEIASQEEIDDAQDTYVSPATITRRTLAPPPNATAISKNHVWIDAKKKRVILDGYVAMTDGPLEMFACPEGTKEHESIIGTLARAKEVHAALLAVSTMRGTPVEFLPSLFLQLVNEFACGSAIVTAMGNSNPLMDGPGLKGKNRKQMEPDWVFSEADSGKTESGKNSIALTRVT